MAGLSPGNLFGTTSILPGQTKALTKPALSTKMDVHLDQEHPDNASAGRDQPPSRHNSSSRKSMTAATGKMVLGIPRERTGTQAPVLIAK